MILAAVLLLVPRPSYIDDAKRVPGNGPGPHRDANGYRDDTVFLTFARRPGAVFLPLDGVGAKPRRRARRRLEFWAFVPAGPGQPRHADLRAERLRADHPQRQPVALVAERDRTGLAGPGACRGG